MRPTQSGIDVIMINVPAERNTENQAPFDPFTTIDSGFKRPTEYLLCLTIMIHQELNLSYKLVI